MAALDEMARRDAERVRDRLDRRRAEKRAESEASRERIDQLWRDYRPPPLTAKERDLIRSGQKAAPRDLDRGRDLAVNAPWHDSLGGYYGVEELDFE